LTVGLGLVVGVWCVVEWLGSGEDDSAVFELEHEAVEKEEESEDPAVDGVLEDEEGGAGIWASIVGDAWMVGAVVRVLVREGGAEVEIEIEEACQACV
jgi:hypothetical protein